MTDAAPRDATRPQPTPVDLTAIDSRHPEHESPEHLLGTTVAETVAGVSGVHHLGGIAARTLDRARRQVLGSSSAPGVTVSKDGDTTVIDLDIVVEYPHPIADVIERARTQATRAAQQVAPGVVDVNVTVTDIHGPFDRDPAVLDAIDRAGDGARDLKDRASEGARDLRDRASDGARELKDRASSVASDLSDQAGAQADEIKARAADLTAQAVSAADDLQQKAGATADDLQQKAADTADGVQQKADASAAELAEQAEQLAERADEKADAALEALGEPTTEAVTTARVDVAQPTEPRDTTVPVGRELPASETRE